MRKTKIICTMGPSTDKGDVMEQLVREGMDVARFNFSHGPHDEQRGRIQKLREPVSYTHLTEPLKQKSHQEIHMM